MEGPVHQAPASLHIHSRDHVEIEAMEKTHRTAESEEGLMDVTELCRQAAAMLGPNEMIHNADFNLYSAMSALELMDAKMDKASPALQPLESKIVSGVLPTNLDTTPCSITRTKPVAAMKDDSWDGEAVQSAAIPAGGATRLCDALSERALSVLDGMSVCEVAWLEGGSLPETIYACLYFHPIAYSAMLRDLGWNPPPRGSDGVGAVAMDLDIGEAQAGKIFPWKPVERSLTLAVLAMSLATLRCCSVIRDVIILADIFEEEDFYPSTFGFRLSPPIEDGSLTGLLDLATGAIEERIGAAEQDQECAANHIADKTILVHLAARKEMLLACLALRDAFTNKQRQRRLQNLAKQRAEREAKRRQQESEVDELFESKKGCSTSSTGSRLGRADSAESAPEPGKSTMELDESERRVAAAAAGLAALTMCRDSSAEAQAQNRTGEQGPRSQAEALLSEDGGREENMRGSSSAPAKCTVDSETCGVSGGRGTEASPGGVDVSLGDLPQDPEVPKSVRVTPSAPLADEALSRTRSQEGKGTESVGGDAEGGIDLAIEGKQALGTVTEDPGAPPQRVPLPAVPESMPVNLEKHGDRDVWAAGGTQTEKERGREGEGEEPPPEDIEAPLRGIERCEGHLRAAHDTFGSILEALSARDLNTGLTSLPGETTSQSPPKITPRSRDSTSAGSKRSQGTRGDSMVEKQSRDVRGEPVRAEDGGAAASSNKTTGVSPEPAAVAEARNVGENVVAGAIGVKTDSQAATEAVVMPMKFGGENGGFAFKADMNRHLLGSSPHHHVHFRWGRGDGVKALRVLVREAATACEVIKCRDLAEVRRHLQSFMQPPSEDGSSAPGKSMAGTVGLFARSVAAVCLYRQNLVLGRFNMMVFVADAMVDMGVPEAVVNSPAGMAFLERVGKPVYETLRVLCLNRARQRNSLELQMMDWRVLQNYADTVDEAFVQQYGLADSTPRYTAKWALCELLGLMHKYIETGVELQLPSSHELRGTYWYWDFVITTKMITEGSLWEAKVQLAAVKASMEEERRAQQEAALEQAATTAEAHLEPKRLKKTTAEKVAMTAAAAAAAAAAATTRAAVVTVPPPGSKKGSKKKKGGKKKRADSGGTAAAAGAAAGAGGGGKVEGAPGVKVGREKEGVSKVVLSAVPVKSEREKSWEARREVEAADMKLRQCLCRGTVRLLAGLESLNFFGEKPGSFRFTTAAIVHRERYRPFQALDVPAWQAYDDFLAAVAFPPEDAGAVVASAGECFKSARSIASELLRQGEALAEEREAATTGGAGGAASNEGDKQVSRVSIYDGGDSSNTGVTEAWAAAKSELLSLATVSVSNAVVSLQVAKRVQAATATLEKQGRDGVRAVRGRAKVEFGANSQFPVVIATFE